MFERGRCESPSQGQKTAIPVEITLDDGTAAKGKLFLAPSARDLATELNAVSAFLEFQPYGGERMFIARSALKTVRAVQVPVAGNLDARLKDDLFDPYAVLGLRAGASWEDIRASYLRLSKLYHPDRYANAELPPEVASYLSATARRVNAAYAALEALRKVARPPSARRVEAAYASHPLS